MRTTLGYLHGGLAMKFAKPPLAIEQQIYLFQSRVMTIDDQDRDLFTFSFSPNSTVLYTLGNMA